MLSNIKYIIKQNRWFLWPYVLFFCALLFYVLYTEKHEGFLFLNPSESTIFDTFFKYMTYLGDGITALIIALLLLFANRKWALGFLLSFLVSGGITQLFKNFVFSNVMRPSSALGIDKVHQVAGIDLHGLMSFPSGHTTAAFAIYCSLAILLANKRMGLLCLLFAVLIGYSRIYLSQHFPVDVLVGSGIGVISTILVFSFFNPKQLHGI